MRFQNKMKGQRGVSLIECGIVIFFVAVVALIGVRRTGLKTSSSIDCSGQKIADFGVVADGVGPVPGAAITAPCQTAPGEIKVENTHRIDPNQRTHSR